MALNEFILLPLRDSYNIQLGDDVTTTQFDSGMPRQRLTSIGKPHQVDVTFRHKNQHQEYLYNFWMLHRTKPFMMRLLAGSSEISWFECRFVGGLNHTEVGFNVHQCSIGLIVKPNRFDKQVAQDYVDAYTLTGGDLSTFFNALEKLVNEDLPSAMRGLNA